MLTVVLSLRLSSSKCECSLGLSLDRKMGLQLHFSSLKLLHLKGECLVSLDELGRHGSVGLSNEKILKSLGFLLESFLLNLELLLLLEQYSFLRVDRVGLGLHTRISACGHAMHQNRMTALQRVAMTYREWS